MVKKNQLKLHHVHNGSSTFLTEDFFCDAPGFSGIILEFSFYGKIFQKGTEPIVLGSNRTYKRVILRRPHIMH